MLMMILCFSISIIFLQMKHPLSMGLTLLIQTFFICLTSGIYMNTFWYSYILFLIFIGGMLVLFIYITSLSSNEMFSTSSLFFLFILISISMILFFLFIDKFLLENNFSNMEMKLLSNFKIFIHENMSINKIYNFPINMITLLLINYLFLTLLMSVKITKKNYGPLRSSMN